jgi:hypothetical protein
MGRFDKAYVYNAGQRDHTKPRIVYYKGERRRMLWPAGTVGRYVNLQGSVVQCVLIPPGVPFSKEAEASAKAKLHAHKTFDGDVVGFIDHTKCPLKTGVRDLDERISEEFEKTFAGIPPCKEHPVTFKKTSKGIEYFDSCPHVQALIEARRKLHSEKVAARMKRLKTVQEIEQAKLDAAEQQARDTRALLEKVVDRLDAPRSRKQQTPEPSE